MSTKPGAGQSHVISAKQLATNIARFLSTSRYIEEAGDIKILLFDSARADPDVFVAIVADVLRQISVDSLCLVAANDIVGVANDRKYIYAHVRAALKVESVNVYADVHATEPNRHFAEIAQAMPRQISVIRTPGEYLQRLRAEDVWAGAATSGEVQLAIQLEANRVAKNVGKGVSSFTIGPDCIDFLKAREAFGSAQYSSLVLTKCGMLVARAGNLEIDEVRESANSNSACVVRPQDGARAKRLHITKSHQALRLMFWESANGKIEFASLRNKFDVEIDD